jgi:hypothetical protein
MDTVAQRLLETVSWGTKARLYTGAGLSILDFGSDVYMIRAYATTGQMGTAQLLASMVGLCVLLQLLAVFMNTRKAPKRVRAREMLIVLSGIAPGIHAKRVADGAETRKHAIYGSEFELALARCAEMAFESIPGCCLQIYACIIMLEEQGTWSKRALGSILASALATGYGAATIR